MTTELGSDSLHQVVVGIDGSESSRHALRWARYLAAATGSTIEAVTTWIPYIAYGPMVIGPGRIPPSWNPAVDAEKALAETVSEVFGENPPPGMRLTVREGNAAEVLVEASRSAQLLVIGSRGRGGFAGLLLGSVSAACVHHAMCPVVVLHGDNPPPDLTEADRSGDGR